MPKQGWKIDQFHKGLNDHSDPKDIDSEEFTAVDDIYIGKKGQARSQGGSEKDSSVNPFSSHSSIIPGKGFHKLNNDYSFNASNTDNAVVVTLNHVTISQDGGISHATFTIADLVAIINGQPTAGIVRFRLKLVASGGATTYLMDDSGTSNLFNFEAQGDAIDNESGGGVADRFDNTLTANGSDITIIDPNYKSGNDAIFAKNTDAWSTEDNPQHGSTNVQDMNDIFGVTDSDYRAIGFYYHAWFANQTANGSSYHPYHNYGGEVSYDGWDEPENMGSYWEYNDYSAYENISYQYSRLAFAQWIVGRINAYEGTSGWNAELIGTEPFGSGEEPDGPTIKIYSTSQAAGNNDLTIRPQFTESSSISGGGADALVSTPYNMANNILTELSDDYVNIAGDNGMMRLVGEKTTGGFTSNEAEVWDINLDGESTGGVFYCNIIKNSDGTSFDIHFNISGTVESMIDTMETLVNANCSSFLSTEQRDSGKTLRLTADAVGTNAGFTVSAWIDYDENVFDYETADEQLSLITESPNVTGQVIDGAGTIKRLYLDAFSFNAGTWSNKFRTISNAKGRDFNWVYGTNSKYKSDPFFYEEGSRLRIIDGNFKLPNKNKYVGFVDNTKHFFNSDGVAQWAWNINIPVGFVCQDNDKFWKYTEGDSNYPNTVEYGVIKNAYEDIDNDDWAGAGYAKLKLFITKHASSDGIDWDESVIKVYATVIYDDNSESMPGHIFDLGSGTNLLNMGAVGDADTLRIKAYLRPQDSTGNYCFPDRRIQGVHLYYSDEKEEHETLWDLGIIDFHNGFKKAAEITTVDSTTGNQNTHEWQYYTGTTTPGLRLYDGTNDYIEYKSAPKTLTFEDFNAYSVNTVTTTSQIRYKAACVAGRRTFIGNIEVTEGSKKRIYNDRMVMSPVNDLDTFPYPSNVLDLDISDGDEIIALATMGDRLIQFKKNICYIVNISTGIARDFFVESRNKYKGILNRYAFCEVEDSIFWFNKNSAYLFDGETILDLFIKDDGDNLSQRINVDTWSKFVSSDSFCRYNPPTKEVFIIKKAEHGTAPENGSCYIYNFVTNSWTKGSRSFFAGNNKVLTNFINQGTEGSVGAMYLGAYGEEDADGGIPT